MHVLVLGAGVIGTSAAWYLQKAGHQVTVLERQGGAGRETSFANGGQISVSHAEPWANPSAPLKLMKWLGREDAPLLFRLRADWRQWRWGLSFLRECTAARTSRNIAQIVNLGLYSRQSLQELRAETGIQYDHLERGILHFYTSQSEWDAAQEPAEVMRRHGADLDMLTPDQVVAIEPALAGARDKIVGGSMTVADESGDAGMFTRELAKLCEAAGVSFLYNTTVFGMNEEGGEITGVRVRSEDGSYATLQADAYVVCLGSYSPMMVRPHGIDLNIYPAKGYSVSMPVADPDKAYHVSLTDDEYKLVFSRLGNRLRIAGTAELNGYNLDLNPVRCEAIVRRVEELFPGAGDTSQASFWTGLRPLTPSNVPYIGRTRVRNLYLDTGHGTLGWTHACGSGRAIADIISGNNPPVDFAFTQA
ncbi:D-amino acid dehydrogenase [Terrihabitans rhizophilus]|uniref:D-amino acid dehydrogenase n=1 Tax=Terrihabitans rhizophilus TaxID=3092662 RepID=A0ABU4RRU9_9HYPH|nr:D-amino acid dehydrogenase [Terrihabitans sp. PJ23]MDX6806355.1 D-amino acid dehydrogenase [Terrihabitans sp. PJ23]